VAAGRGQPREQRDLAWKKSPFAAQGGTWEGNDSADVGPESLARCESAWKSEMKTGAIRET
jgi:hypothetical protein